MDALIAERHLTLKKVFCGICLCLLASVSVLHASEPTISEVDARLEFLHGRLSSEQRSAFLWCYGWTIGYSIGVAAQGALYFASTDEDIKAQAWVSAAGTAIGLISQLSNWLPAVSAADRLEGFERASDSEKLILLERAEDSLKKSAEIEAFGRTWLMHAGSLLIATATSAVLWFRYDLRSEAITNFATSIAVGEANIWTQPTAAINDWQEYQNKFGGPFVKIKF